jgi:hypothetical protein
MGPISHADGRDPPRLFDELVPGVAAMVDDLFVGAEHPVREPVVANELPDIFLRIEFGTFRWDRDDGDIVGDHQLGRQVPAGLVHEQHGVSAGIDCEGDLRQVQIHRVGVAERHDEARSLALLRTYGSEDVGRLRALIVRGRWPRSALRPAPGDLVLRGNDPPDRFLFRAICPTRASSVNQISIGLPRGRDPLTLSNSAAKPLF